MHAARAETLPLCHGKRSLSCPRLAASRAAWQSLGALPGCKGGGKWGIVGSGVVDVLGRWCGAPGPHAEVARVCDVKYGGKTTCQNRRQAAE